ncbi:hypothetical protein GGR51DRAFT_518637 [Nemania sp. FL0031]|nr:hypothetical protein GGR51DRAFT_518637 [Nemania sp. FL0031]
MNATIQIWLVKASFAVCFLFLMITACQHQHFCYYHFDSSVGNLSHLSVGFLSTERQTNFRPVSTVLDSRSLIGWFEGLIHLFHTFSDYRSIIVVFLGIKPRNLDTTLLLTVIRIP